MIFLLFAFIIQEMYMLVIYNLIQSLSANDKLLKRHIIKKVVFFGPSYSKKQLWYIVNASYKKR